jgi:hypothetical protein
MSETKNSDDLVMIKFDSDKCLEMMIGNAKIEGWKAPDVGLGRMRFVHDDGTEFRANRGQDSNWMEGCWDDFIAFLIETQP